MRLDNGQIGLSPSDLTAYLACPHATTLSMAVARGQMQKPVVDNPDAEMVWRKGNEHEHAYLEHLRAQGMSIAEITTGPDLDYPAAAEATVAAMKDGVDIVFQAAFAHGRWRGLADFVMRTEHPSDLGAHSYEVLDTKLSRSAKPSHLLQLLFYNQEIARVQGLQPAAIHVHLGSGDTVSFAPTDFAAYYRRIRARFERFTDEARATSPYPCSHCDLCEFKPVCEKEWERTDHLSRVARIQRRQVERLAGAGITTLAGLATAPDGLCVDGIPQASLSKLRAQAALQHRRAAEGPIVEVLPPAAGTGFALLPPPSPGDLFFDIEGHPFWELSGGLEYLWGVTDVGDDFRPEWAENHAGERAAFEAIVDRITARRAEYPDMHVYHYAAYEITALRRLMGRYGTREEELDNLMRGDVFVDLYAVVRNAIRASERGYGLKDLEAFLPITREASISDGGSSIVAYELYLQTKNPAILDDIAHYNREDCVATRLLRDWLLTLKADAVARFGPIPEAEPEEPRETPEAALERALVREALLECSTQGAELLALLLDYHHREQKPVWWAFFDRLEKTPDELVDDAESIGLLVPAGEPVPEKKSWVHEFTYPPQEHRLRSGDGPHDPATGKTAGTLMAVDRDARRVWLKRGPSLDDVPLPEALLPGRPFDARDQQSALMRIGQSLLKGDGRYLAAESMLLRTPFERDIQTTDLDELTALVRGLDGRHLVIQGPPGSGKTWTAGRLVAALVEGGETVGLASTSHKAIHNMLDAVEEAAAEEGLRFDGRKKSSAGNPESEYESQNVSHHAGAADILGAQVAGGTAWLFAREDQEGTLDYLFIDEAGQVSLADALAMSTCARNVILLGDPQQLPQVVQGHHPDGSEASVLEHLLGENATVPPNRGVFLESTYRLHPDVCDYVSECFYEGRLRPDHTTAGRTTPLGTGLRYLEVAHEGCRQSSAQEVGVIVAKVDELRAAGVPDDEIMVVAAYNAQVDLLREQLPAAVRAGTVDKFQGQEADVVVYSMASSSGDDVPRSLEFLLSRNRLNVAISRARCLAYLVCSPRLLEVDCGTIDHMRLANALCRFVEMAEEKS